MADELIDKANAVYYAGKVISRQINIESKCSLL
jgi:hypothetical protein